MRGFRYAGISALIKSSDSEVRLVGRMFPPFVGESQAEHLMGLKQPILSFFLQFLAVLVHVRRASLQGN